MLCAILHHLYIKKNTHGVTFSKIAGFNIRLYAWLFRPVSNTSENNMRFRSSRRRCAIKKKFSRKISQNPQENICARKTPAPATFLKKRLWCRCFPVNFAKFSKTPFSQNTSGRVLQEGVRDLYQRLI